MTDFTDRLPAYTFQQPRYAPEDKDAYHVRPPNDQRENFARMINALMDTYHLSTVNAALCAAVEIAYRTSSR